MSKFIDKQLEVLQATQRKQQELIDDYKKQVEMFTGAPQPQLSGSSVGPFQTMDPMERIQQEIANRPKGDPMREGPRQGLTPDQYSQRNVQAFQDLRQDPVNAETAGLRQNPSFWDEDLGDMAQSLKQGAVNIQKQGIAAGMMSNSVGPTRTGTSYTRFKDDNVAQLPAEERAKIKVDNFLKSQQLLREADAVSKAIQADKSNRAQILSHFKDAEIQRKTAERAAEIQAKKDAGEWTGTDAAAEIANQFMDTINANLDRPSLILESAVSSIPDLIIGGTLGKTFAGMAATAKNAARIATATGIGTTAAQEGLSAVAEVAQDIDEAKHEELLESSPVYLDLIQSGLSEDAARQKLTQYAGNMAFALTGVLTGAAAAVTGSGELMGKLFMPTSRLGKSFRDVATDGEVSNLAEVSKDVFGDMTPEEYMQRVNKDSVTAGYEKYRRENPDATPADILMDSEARAKIAEDSPQITLDKATKDLEDIKKSAETPAVEKPDSPSAVTDYIAQAKKDYAAAKINDHLAKNPDVTPMDIATDRELRDEIVGDIPELTRGQAAEDLRSMAQTAAENAAEKPSPFLVRALKGTGIAVAKTARFTATNPVTKGVLGEGAQEIVEGGGGQFAQNVAKQTYVDKDQDLTEGVGQAAGEGFLAGSALGGAVTAAAVPVAMFNANKEYRRLTKEAKEKVIADRHKAFSREVSKAKESGDFSKVIDTAHPDFNFKRVVGMLEERSKEKKVDKVENYKVLAKVVANYALDHIELPSEMLETEDLTPEQEKLLREQISKATAELESIGERASKMFQEARQAAIVAAADVKTATDANADPAAQSVAHKRIMGSIKLNPESLTKADADTLLNSDLISEADKEFIRNTQLYTGQTLAKIHEASGYVMNGGLDPYGNSWVGLNQYKDWITADLEFGDRESADKLLDRLSSFTQQRAHKYNTALKASKLPRGDEQTALLESVNIHKGITPKLLNTLKVEMEISDSYNKLMKSLASLDPDDTSDDSGDSDDTGSGDDTTNGQAPIDGNVRTVGGYMDRSDEDIGDIEFDYQLPKSRVKQTYRITPEGTILKIKDGKVVTHKGMNRYSEKSAKILHGIAAQKREAIRAKEEADYFSKNPDKLPKGTAVKLKNRTYVVTPDGKVVTAGGYETSSETANAVKAAAKIQGTPTGKGKGKGKGSKPPTTSTGTNTNEVTVTVSGRKFAVSSQGGVRSLDGKGFTKEQRDAAIAAAKQQPPSSNQQQQQPSGQSFKDTLINLLKNPLTKETRGKILNDLRRATVDRNDQYENVIFTRMMGYISKFAPDFQIRLVDKNSTDATDAAFYAKNVAGSINYSTQTISLNTDNWKGNPDALYRELDHLATAGYIYDIADRNTKEYQELVTIWKEVSQLPTDGLDKRTKGLMDYFSGRMEAYKHFVTEDGEPNVKAVNEMVTLAKTDPKIREIMKAHKLKNTTQSIYDALISLLAKMFGITKQDGISAYEAIVVLSDPDGVLPTAPPFRPVVNPVPAYVPEKASQRENVLDLLKTAVTVIDGSISRGLASGSANAETEDYIQGNRILKKIKEAVSLLESDPSMTVAKLLKDKVLTVDDIETDYTDTMATIYNKYTRREEDDSTRDDLITALTEIEDAQFDFNQGNLFSDEDLKQPTKLTPEEREKARRELGDVEVEVALGKNPQTYTVTPDNTVINTKTKRKLTAQKSIDLVVAEANKLRDKMIDDARKNGSTQQGSSNTFKGTKVTPIATLKEANEKLRDLFATMSAQLIPDNVKKIAGEVDAQSVKDFLSDVAFIRTLNAALKKHDVNTPLDMMSPKVFNGLAAAVRILSSTVKEPDGFLEILHKIGVLPQMQEQNMFEEFQSVVTGEGILGGSEPVRQQQNSTPDDSTPTKTVEDWAESINKGDIEFDTGANVGSDVAFESEVINEPVDPNLIGTEFDTLYQGKPYKAIFKTNKEGWVWLELNEPSPVKIDTKGIYTPNVAFFNNGLLQQIYTNNIGKPFTQFLADLRNNVNLTAFENTWLDALQNNKYVKDYIVGEPTLFSKQGLAGVSFTDKDFVMYRDFINGKKDAMPVMEAIIHETIHMGTLSSVSGKIVDTSRYSITNERTPIDINWDADESTLTPSEKAFRKEITEIAGIVDANRDSLKSWLQKHSPELNADKTISAIIDRSPSELPTYLLTRPVIMEWAQTVNVGNRTLWNKFVAAVMNVLGVTQNTTGQTLYEKTLAATSEMLISNAMVEQTPINVGSSTTTMEDGFVDVGGGRVRVITQPYTPELVRAEPDYIFVFGDNTKRYGEKGQAVIRNEPNAMGIATKKHPSMHENAFFNDDEFKDNKDIIDKDIQAIIDTGKAVVFPKAGIGTGLADLPNKAPKTWNYLVNQMKIKFGVKLTKNGIKLLKPKAGRVNRTAANPEQAKAWFQNSDLVKEYFERADVTTKSGSDINPLQVDRDILSELAENPAIATEYMAEGTELTDIQTDLIGDLTSFHPTITKAINAAFKTREMAKYKDMMQFLADKGVLPESVKSAYTVALYEWMGISAYDTLHNDDEVINRIVSADYGDRVTTRLRGLLQFAGVPEDMVVTAIGKSIAKHLGFRSKTDIPPNMEANFYNSLGLFGVKVLTDLGHIQINTIVGEDIDRAMGKAVNQETGAQTIRFLRATSDPDSNYKLHPDSSFASNAIKGSQGLLSKVFGKGTVLQGPSLTKPTKAVSKQKGTHLNVPAAAKKIINKHNQRKNLVNKGMQAVVSKLPADNLKKILGFKTDAEIDKMHVHNRENAKGNNASIERSITHWDNFVEGDLQNDLDKPFYFRWEQWKNLRLGITSNTVNPQADKFHRHMLHLADQMQELDKNDSKQMEYFYVAIAQGLDVDIDKQANSKSVMQVSKILARKDVKAAIAELQKANANEAFDADLVTDVVVSLKGKMHTLHALQAYAEYLSSEGDTFTTSYALEADGVTNGPAIGLIQFADIDDWTKVRARLKRVSMNIDNDSQQYGEWKEDPTNDDNYQAIARTTDAALWRSIDDFIIKEDFTLQDPHAIKRMFDGVVGSLLEQKEGIDGTTVTKAGRDLTKYPLMTALYGASKKAIKRALGNFVVDQIYSAIEKNANNPAELDRIIALTLEGIGITNDHAIKREQAKLRAKPLEYTLNPDWEYTLHRTGQETYGESVYAAIESNYTSLIARRKELNKAMTITFHLFKEQYDFMVKKRTAELAAQGKLWETWETLPKSELEKIMEELLESQPIMHNYFSKLSGQLNEGLYTGKFKRGVKSGAGATMYQQEQSYKNARGSVKVSQRLREMVDGGVSPTVLAIQALDAATMIMTLENSAVLNVHDAIFAAIKTLGVDVENINTNFTKAMIEMNIYEEALNTLERAWKRISEFDTKYDQDSIYAPELLKALGSWKKGKFVPLPADKVVFEITATIATMRDYSKQMQKDKERMLARITNMGQYYFEGHGINPKDILKKPANASERALGSSDVLNGIDPAELGASSDETVQTLNKMTVEGVFDELDKLGGKSESSTHKERLRTVLRTVVADVMTPLTLRLKENMVGTFGQIAEDNILMLVQAQGQGNNHSPATVNAGLKMSAQEVLTHELVHAVLRTAIDGDSIAKRELQKIFNYVHKNNLITVDDLVGDGTTREEAQKTLDYFMKIRTDAVIGGKSYSNYLQEFAAYALTNEKVIAALSKHSIPVHFDGNLRGKTVTETLRNVFSMVTDRMFRKITSVKTGMPLDQAMQSLAMDLVRREGENKNLLFSAASWVGKQISEEAETLDKLFNKGVEKLGASSRVRNSKWNLVRASGNLARTRYDAALKFIEYVKLTTGKANGRQGFIGAMITSMLGATESTQKFHRLLLTKNRMIDTARQKQESATVQVLNDSFLDMTLEPKHKIALTKAGLKADMEVLLDIYTPDKIANMLKNPTVLNQEISILRAQLMRSEGGTFYVNGAQSLGYYMATGLVDTPHLLLNAANIATMYGISNVTVPADADNWVDTIDRLASLEALKHTDQEHKTNMADVIDKDVEGFKFTMDLHRSMKAESRDELFFGNEFNLIKGYTVEVTNPNKAIITAPLSEAKDLEARGYIRQPKPLPRDPVHPQVMYTFVHPYGAATPYAAGLMSLTSKQAKGTNALKYNRNAGDSGVVAHVQTEKDLIQITKRKAGQTAQLFKRVQKDPAKTSYREAHMVPTFNAKGKITDYRYVMSEAVKDSVLEKNNEFDVVLGKMASSTIDKVNTRDVNYRTIQALHEQWVTEKDFYAEAYLEISPKSTDPVLKEHWNNLPEEAKAVARRTFGKNAVYVRKDMEALVFGFREFSVSDIIDKPAEQRTYVQNAIAETAKFILGDHAARRIRKAGDMWQEYVKLAKNYVVVRTGVVTMANAASNSLQLNLHGVSYEDIIRDQAQGYTAAYDYLKNAQELNKLELLINLGKTVDTERVAELRHAQATSTVGDLIEEGLLQTIVEDVNTSSGSFTFKSQAESKVTDKTGEFTDSMPSSLKKLGKNLLVMEDSDTYRVLNQAAQLSDFVARYTLVNHLMKNEGMTRQEAIDKAMDVFIDYQIPDHAALQYLNNMGILWFTKYYFRVQKTIIGSFVQSPAKTMLQLTLSGLTGSPTILDSFMSPSGLLNRLALPEDPADLILESAYAQYL